MQIDIFSEMQRPRELWDDDAYEHTLIEETLEQARLADELGYACWWQVEHHGAVEFSYSSAPEMMLTAIARGTERLRVGHSAVLSPHRFNHPIRVAERAAFLDHLSDGRLELGLARSTVKEWRAFNIDGDETREQMQQAFELIPQLWTQDSVNWDSEDFQIQDFTLTPKPLQKPHPPLWQACSGPASFEQAGRNGVGALANTLWRSLDQVEEIVESYKRGIAQCERPAGEFINDQIAFFTFVHCVEDGDARLSSAAAGAAAWYTNTALTFFEARESFLRRARELEAARDEAGGDLTGRFLEDEDAESTRAQLMHARIMNGETVPDEEVFEILSEQQSLVVGDQQACLEKMKRYEEVGIDRLMSFHQVGKLRHEEVTRSIRLIGELIPEFHGKE